MWVVVETRWLRQVCRWLDGVRPDSPSFVKRTDWGYEFSGMTLGIAGYLEHYFRGLC
jgi:hypothetical protein